MTRKDEINLATRVAFLKAGVDKESYRQGIEWADEHPKSGLVDIDAACLWLIDSLKAYNLMPTTAVEYFVGGFKKFCEIRNKELWQEKKM